MPIRVIAHDMRTHRLRLVEMASFIRRVIARHTGAFTIEIHLFFSKSQQVAVSFKHPVALPRQRPAMPRTAGDVRWRPNETRRPCPMQLCGSRSVRS